jgi:hypothetical protein
MTSGIRSGIRSGLRSGLNPGTDPMAGVDFDAAREVYVPASADQWATALAAAGISSGGPMAVWFPGSSMVDTIGDADLTNDGPMATGQPVAGWSTTAAECGDLGGFYSVRNNTDADLPDVSATSALLIGYIAITDPGAADRGVILVGGARGIVTAANLPKVSNGTNAATGSGNLTTAVRPWVVRQNVTASTTDLFTDLEKVNATYAVSAANQRVFYGAALEAAPGMQVLYGALFKGAAAELSDAQLRTLLETLGWEVAW